MTYALIFITIYLSIGFGFALASWLQAAEIQVKEKKPYDRLLCINTVYFTAFWWLIAIHCYRADIKRSIPDLQYTLEEIEKRKDKKS